MLRREAEWPSNKNILIADTIWQNQALSQVLWFWGQNTFLGVKDFCFIIWLKQSFLSTTKFVGAQKRFGGNYPRMSPMSAGLGRNAARKSFIRGLHVCAGGLDILKIYMNSQHEQHLQIVQVNYKYFPAIPIMGS